MAREKNNNNFLLRFKYNKFHLYFKNILPWNKLLPHFYYINQFTSYKIVDYYICG